MFFAVHYELIHVPSPIKSSVGDFSVSLSEASPAPVVTNATLA